jgi:magnesium chelatase subunit D
VTGAPEPDGWITAASAAALFATDPTGTGGVHLRALPGPVREAWTTMLRALLGPELPYRRVPAHIRDDRLLGGLDLTATLQTGRPIAQRGVLAEADGGVIELPMAERMDTALAARITSVLDAGEVVLERDGIASRTATRFGVVAVDEGISDDERPPPALLDRLAFVVDLIDLSWRDTDTTLFDPQQIAAARARRARVQCPAEMTEALTGTALALGVWSLRPTQLAVRVARAAAALDGRDEVNRDDVTLAARLVLAPRATRLPAPPPDADEATEEQPAEPPENEDERTDPPPPPEDDDERESPNTEQVQELGEVVLEAATASIPAELLMKLSQAAGPRTSAGQGGKSGASQRSKLRGRPVGVERGDPATGARLSVLDTLRAAAPWQRVRASTAGEQAAGGRDRIATAHRGAGRRLPRGAIPTERGDDDHLRRRRVRIGRHQPTGRSERRDRAVARRLLRPSRPGGTDRVSRAWCGVVAAADALAGAGQA